MATAKFAGDSKRTQIYKDKIDAILNAVGFSSKQRDRINSVGWSKVKEYIHLLSREKESPHYFEKWTAFAERDDVTVEIVKQVVRRGKGPAMPQKRDKGIMLRMPELLRDEFEAALEMRGWQHQDGDRGSGRSGLEDALEKLLSDASKWHAYKAAHPA